MPTARAAALAACLAIAALLAPAAAAQMTLRVDALDASRRLLHAELTMPADPGPMDVYYIEWTPGNHNPSGPVQNLVNFRVNAGGDTLEWKRDPTHTVRHTFTVPEGEDEVTLTYSYILNQPSVNSRSTDSYGLRSLGVVNWNTVLFEPAGADKDNLTVDASIELPSGWLLASPLPVKVARGGRYDFEPVSLAELIDSPAIYGEFLATWEMTEPTGVPHFTDAVASDPADLVMSGELLTTLNEMLAQTQKVFGPFPYEQFRFLTVLDSDVPGAGLEHTECTYISYPDDRFTNDKASALGTFPHEYIHCWNGKLRAPHGLLHRDYHTPGETELLWVYEGLTSYYDDVIMARSGMYTPEEYADRLAGTIERYQLQAGRRWRSVEDTASGQRHLRARSPHWAELRRRQDYYSEGALFWLAADAVIRSGTDNERSLDDFAIAFFNRAPVAAGSPITYTRSDVVRGLREVYPQQDWDSMIEDYIEEPVETLEHPVTGLLNRAWTYEAEPTEEQAEGENAPYEDLAERTLGFSTDRDGEIETVLAGSRADEAKVSYGMTVLAVNGWAFTPEKLKRAIEHSEENGEVELVVRFDDRVEVRTIVYSDGLKYPRMELKDGAFDTLSAIIAPK